VIRRRVTLATVAGLTAALALTACGGNSDTALNTSSGAAADQAATDLSQARPATGDQQSGDAGGGDQGGDVSAAGGGYGSADGSGSAGGSGDYGDDGAAGSAGSYGSAGSGSAGGSAGVMTTWLRTKKTKSVGTTIVVDGKNMTLYRFDKDVKGKASNCNGGCAAKWPAALTNGSEPRLRGVDQSLVGKVKRADGGWQAHPRRLAAVPVRAGPEAR
jgi:predicted lipoprotein with Yx(FWY)xxD motif